MARDRLDDWARTTRDCEAQLLAAWWLPALAEILGSPIHRPDPLRWLGLRYRSAVPGAAAGLPEPTDG